jgi:hypothetical protein
MVRNVCYNDKAFKDLCDIIVKTTEEIVPKRKIKKRKPKLQMMSEDILKAIEQKKRAIPSGVSYVELSTCS